MLAPLRPSFPPRLDASALTAAITILLASAPADAQTSAPLNLPRLSAPVSIDGVPNDPAWAAIDPLPLTMYMPVFRGTPTQRTEIRVAYDDENVYIAGWMFDTQPNQIRVNSLYRDRWNGDDALAIYIDAFNDNHSSKWFGITAAGMRFDQLVSDDGATLNDSWDSFWTARTTRTDEGWFAEVRIPFSTLGFRVDAEGKVVMGLTVTRLVSRIRERVTFPEIDPKFEFRRPSLARDVVLRDVRQRKQVYVTPYALTGVERNAFALGTTPSAGFGTNRETTRELGADLRYQISNSLTLDLTANTDFAQVEADDQQVNLDRFELFFPERRRFFQEGSGVFDFYMGSNVRLFHSRRIGLTSAGTPRPVIGGARLVGRLGSWDVGFLELQTEEEGPLAGENFGVLRLRRPVLNRWSTVGGIATSYVSDDQRMLALGTDAVVRVQGDDYLTLKWAATAEDGESSGISIEDRSHLYMGWQRRTERGLSFEVTGSHSGAAFRPPIGFQARRDFSTLNAITNWYRFTDNHPVFRRVFPGALAFSTFRNADGALESGQYAVWLQWETKGGGGGWIEPKYFHENVLTPFTIGGEIHIPAGKHDFADLQLALQMSSGRKLRMNADLRAGTYFDGRRAQAILTPTWNVSPHLELGADYQITALRFPVRDEEANISVLRLRVRTALDVRLSANAFVQYNSTTDRLDFNVRARYAFAEGTDLWLVYNEGLDTERSRELPSDPMPPRSLARSFILKYTHTFGL